MKTKNEKVSPRHPRTLPDPLGCCVMKLVMTTATPIALVKKTLVKKPSTRAWKKKRKKSSAELLGNKKMRVP